MKPGFFGVAAAVVVLSIRGALLWLLVPVGTLIWAFGFQWLGENRSSLGAFLGWLDLNLAFVLIQGPFSSLFPTAPAKWIPASERSKVTHRIGAGGPSLR